MCCSLTSTRNIFRKRWGGGLSVALVKAIREVEDKSSVMVVRKYQDLYSELGAILFWMKGQRLSQADNITRHIF